MHLDGWAFDAEALAMARRFGYQIREVGIDGLTDPTPVVSIRDVLLPVTGELLPRVESVRKATRQVGVKAGTLETKP